MIRSDFARFVLRFGLLLGALNLLLLVPWVHSHFVLPWTILNAGWAAKLVSFTGEGYVVQGALVRAGWQWVDVGIGCNGVEALALCVSAILAFSSTWSKKVGGVLMALVGVFGLNLVRLANLFFVARHFPSKLELFHIYIWQTIMAATSFGLFLVWGRFLAHKPAKPLLPESG